MLDELTKCQLFKEMNTSDKQDCLEQFKPQLKKYKKGDTIVYAQDEVVQQLILIKGSVKNEMTDFNGKTITIADMEAPRILAPGFLFGNQSSYPVTIIAKINCEVLAISKQHFIEAINNNHQLQLNFIDLISNQTQFLTRRINFLNFKTIKEKIAQFILMQFKRQGKIEITLPQSQTQLADLFGVARPSLSRAFGQLNQDGIIKLEGKKVTILDMEALKACLN